MSAKLWSFLISLFLFMTYGIMPPAHTPSLSNSAFTAYADDDDEDFDSPDEIADELDDVTEEEDIIDDAQEADEEQQDEVIEEMMFEDDEEDIQDDDDLQIPAGSEHTPEAGDAKVDNELR